jgi:hypothetical protein
MSLLRMFLVIMTVIAAQATTMAQETVPAPVPAPVPDPISTPGVGGIGNLLTCAALQVEIEELQEQIAGVNAGLEQVGPNDPMLVTLVFVRMQLEAQLFMLQWEYAVLCGGNPPPPGDPPVVSEECQQAADELDELNRTINNIWGEINRLNFLLMDPVNPPSPEEKKRLEDDLKKVYKELDDAYGAHNNYQWPLQCGPKPLPRPRNSYGL